MFTLSPLELFGALIVAHMLCDYPLQGDFLAKAKNHRAPLPGVPWQQALAAHSLIHGGAVWLLTGLWWLGAAETAAHALTDYLKSDRRPGFGFHSDQAVHILFKGLWVLIAMGGAYATIWAVSLGGGIAMYLVTTMLSKRKEVSE